MENISNQVLGYIALFIGVVVGWILKGLWNIIRERRRKPLSFIKALEQALNESIEILGLNDQKNKPIDAEYSDGKFRIVEK